MHAGAAQIRSRREAREAAEQGMDLVSACIVNYNAGHLLSEAVGALLASTVPVEVTVCDNGSLDGSVKRLRDRFGADPRLFIIENRRNLGFATATNIALRRARGTYCLVINPDCLVLPDTLEKVIRAIASDPQVGIAGCLIRNPDGSEQAGGRRSVPTPWRSLVRVLHLDRWTPGHPRMRTFLQNREPLPDEPLTVEAISGAFMLTPRKRLTQVGLLDEDYFLHCEDLDWCMRFRRVGWKVLFVPDAEVVHYKGTCSKSRPVFVEWHKHRGMVRFYRTHFRSQYPWPLMVVVVSGVWMRFALLAAWSLAGRVLFQQAPAPEVESRPPLPDPVPVTTRTRAPRPASGREVGPLRWPGRPVLVTGGTGFIGRRLVTALLERGARVKVLTRSPESSPEAWGTHADQITTVGGDLSDPASLAGLCAGIDVLFHLAGYAHADDVATRLDESPHWLVTVDGTQALLAEACASSVKQLVFVSTVKAMGEGNDTCLDEASSPEPEDHYGLAKREAERRVLAAGQRCGMHTVVLRPAMVYGRDNAGNLPRMISAVSRGRFPPLPETHNRRSMVHVDDVVQALLLAAERPIANGRTYIVTDGETYSSRRIYEAICRALGRRLPRWRVPAAVLWAGARLGDLLQALHLPAPLTSASVRKLLGSACYSCAQAKLDLGYRPRHRLEDALPEMVSCALGRGAGPKH